jgi:hypothetical protein
VQIKTHKYGEKVAFLPLNRSAAPLGTRTLPFTKLGIKTKQVVLFSWFGAAFHPLALSHELDALVHFRNECNFRFLFNFNNFLSAVLRKEDTWKRLSTRSLTRNIAKAPA